MADSSRGLLRSSDTRLVQLDFSVDVPEQVIRVSVESELDLLHGFQVRKPVSHG